MALVVKNLNKTLKTFKSVDFSDINTNFVFEVIKKDLTPIINEDSVKQSIRNIIFTNKGERFFNPNFGSDIIYMLFENITPATEQIITDLIKTAINNFEPRANVIEVLVNSYPDENSVLISVVFSTLNSAEPITLDLILNRIR